MELMWYLIFFIHQWNSSERDHVTAYSPIYGFFYLIKAITILAKNAKRQMYNIEYI